MKKPELTFPVYHVIWKDAVSEDAWQEKIEAVKHFKDDWIVHTIGWLIDEKKEYLLLAGSFDIDDNVCQTIKIPQSLVISKVKVGL